jgi:hypothetical protein
VGGVLEEGGKAGAKGMGAQRRKAAVKQAAVTRTGAPSKQAPRPASGRAFAKRAQQVALSVCTFSTVPGNAVCVMSQGGSARAKEGAKKSRHGGVTGNGTNKRKHAAVGTCLGKIVS